MTDPDSPILEMFRQNQAWLQRIDKRLDKLMDAREKAIEKNDKDHLRFTVWLVVLSILVSGGALSSHFIMGFP